MVPSTTPSSRRPQSGFTLVELLAVILIIALMSGFIVASLGGSGGTQKINAGANQLHTLMKLAQSAAISRKQPTRVLIHFDNTEPEKLLRYAIVVYRDDDGGTPTNESDDIWLPFTDGEFLPDGVYFSPALSTGVNGDPTLSIWDADIDLDSATPVSFSSAPSSQTNYSLDSNGRDNLNHSPGSGKWYVYQFAPSGLYDPPGGDPGTRCVVIDAVNPTGTRLIIPNEEVSDIFRRAQGFVMFRSGNPMFFQNYEQIENGNT